MKNSVSLQTLAYSRGEKKLQDVRPPETDGVDTMNRDEILEVFRSLHIESDEERQALRFDALSFEDSFSIQAFTTNKTCYGSMPEEGANVAYSERDSQ